MEMVDFIVTTLIGIGWLARKVGRVILKVFKLAKSRLDASRAQAAAKAAAAPVATKPAARPASAGAAAASPTAASPASKEVRTAPVARARGHRQTTTTFDIADRIMVVKFGGGWSVTVRIYEQRGVAQRLLRCTEPKMVEQLVFTFMQSVFPLKDASLNDHSLEQVLRDCEVAGATKAAELLRRLGDPQVQPLREISEVAQPAPQDAAPASVASPSVAEEPAPQAPQPKATPRAAAPAGGRSVQGRVVTAGKQASLTGGGATFEVVLETDSGEQEIKKGWHLSELFKQLGVDVGDNVRITDLGRQAIEPGGDGQKRFKSMYDVERV